MFDPIRTRLRITNNTPSRMNITVWDVDSYDWDHERPDHNFQHSSIDPYSAVEHREDLNYWSRSAPFGMTCRFSNGDEVTFRTDQRAVFDEERVYREHGLGGASAGEYLAIQLAEVGEEGTPRDQRNYNSISINRRPDPSRWMSYVPDGTLFSKLTIPGTHDSGATTGGPWGIVTNAWTICQTMDFKTQLDRGIRFLDVRCRHIQDVFAIHHDSIFQGLMFGDVVNACLDWLSAHPSETIVMLVKEENSAPNNSRSFESTFDTYTTRNSSRWYLSEQTPRMGDDVRGKIVLMRRFGRGAGMTGPKGLNVHNGWPQNSSGTLVNGGVTFHVQDLYNSLREGAKESAFAALRDESARGSEADWYVNFTTASSPPFGTPKVVSSSMHETLAKSFDARPNQRYGVVPLDFPEDMSTLIPMLIAQNRLADAPVKTSNTRAASFSEILTRMRQMDSVLNRSQWQPPRTQSGSAP